MKEYTVTGRSISLHSGLVKLTDAQADVRLHRLKKTDKKGVYEIIQPIELKTGEVFSTDTPLGKVVLQHVESKEDEQAIGVALRKLADTLKMSIPALGKLLKEKYQTNVPNNGNTEIPLDLAEKVVAETAAPEKEKTDVTDSDADNGTLPPAGAELAPPLQ